MGKGRLVDLARKKEKGKFASVAEIFNRCSCFFFFYFTNKSNFFRRMFTKKCNVGVTFPEKVVTKGFSLVQYS